VAASFCPARLSPRAHGHTALCTDWHRACLASVPGMKPVRRIAPCTFILIKHTTSTKAPIDALCETLAWCARIARLRSRRAAAPSARAGASPVQQGPHRGYVGTVCDRQRRVRTAARVYAASSRLLANKKQKKTRKRNENRPRLAHQKAQNGAGRATRSHARVWQHTG
jgi:hypothetical protein